MSCAPSPFPHDVYFILNMNRFLLIFGTVEEMQRSLVWLPTWTQCMRLLQDCPATTAEEKRAAQTKIETTLEELYRILLLRLSAGRG